MVTKTAHEPYVYEFVDADPDNATLLGGKGAGLARLVRLGLPVPPGFIVSTRAGRDYLSAARVPEAASAEIQEHLSGLQDKLGRTLGDKAKPLLVSVRSGAPVSMPGMMDTVLNVGLNPSTVDALARETDDPAFAWACYGRLAESYARIVREIPEEDIEDALLGIDTTGGEEQSRAVVATMHNLIAERGCGPLPEDPIQQIAETVEAVFRSWNSPRAAAYRKFRGIDDSIGTAAVVQTMVFGNKGETSGSGVAFTRDPSTGAPGAFGDFLFNAQGEDVVAGTHDPSPIEHLGRRLPAVHDKLRSALLAVEADARDLCEVEFTVDNGSLWILQTRIGQRSGLAAVRVAVSFVEEGVVSPDEAVARVSPAQAEAAAAPAFSEIPRDADVVARGLAASPGAVVGAAVFDVGRAVELAEEGQDVVLVRATTSPGDVAGFIAARGVVTGLGGRTSHAAVVARGMGRPAVCGVGRISVEPDGKRGTIGDIPLDEGTIVSLDGHGGVLALGSLPLEEARRNSDLDQLLAWARERVRVPLLTTLPADDDPTAIILRHRHGKSAREASKHIEGLNRDGVFPSIFVSTAWAATVDRPLTGICSGIGCLDDVISWPLVALGLQPMEATA